MLDWHSCQICYPLEIKLLLLLLYEGIHFLLLIWAGRASSIGSVSAWHVIGPEFYPHLRHILSWRLSHEKIYLAILPLPLIQEEQLSVTGERMYTKYWLTA